MKSFKSLLFLLFLIVPLTVLAGDPEWESGNAVNNCRAAMTFRDIGVRSRPLALVNEGDVGTYINCAYRVNVKDGSYRFGAVLQNYGQSNTTVNCTGVHGVDDGGGEYWTKSLDVPAGTRRYIEWRRDAGWESNVGFQCYLPPDTGLNEIEILK